MEAYVSAGTEFAANKTVCCPINPSGSLTPDRSRAASADDLKASVHAWLNTLHPLGTEIETPRGSEIGTKLELVAFDSGWPKAQFEAPRTIRDKTAAKNLDGHFTAATF